MQAGEKNVTVSMQRITNITNSIVYISKNMMHKALKQISIYHINTLMSKEGKLLKLYEYSFAKLSCRNE